MTVVSGAYTAAYNLLDVGNVELGGFKQRWSYEGRKVSFDAIGTGPIDMIYTGLGFMYLDFVCMEYTAAALEDLMWPWHAILGQAPTAGGSLWADAKPFIMTSCRDDINPQTMSFPKAILSGGFEVALDYSGVRERSIPIRLICFPIKYESGGYGVNFAGAEFPSGCTDMVYFTQTVI